MALQGSSSAAQSAALAEVRQALLLFLLPGLCHKSCVFVF